MTQAMVACTNLVLTIVLALLAVYLPLFSSVFPSKIARDSLYLYNQTHQHRPRQANDVAIRGSSACQHTRVFSFDPLIIHISDFVTMEERTYLRKLASPLLEASTISVGDRTVQHKRRTSSTAFLPPEDPVIRDIVARVIELHGHMDLYRVDVQVTNYQEGQEYQPHFDWYEEGELHINRFSTIFVTLDASCWECETQFPNLQVDWTKRNKEWCSFLDCEQNVLTTKSINGSALFWRNLDDNAQGRRETLHAGLPAKGGTKMGLNIWTEISTSTY